MVIGWLLSAPIAGIAHNQLGSGALRGSIGQTDPVLAALVASYDVEGAVLAPGSVTGIFCKREGGCDLLHSIGSYELLVVKATY